MGPLQGGDLCLYLDRVSDADRHANHCGCIHARRFLQIGFERIYGFHFSGGTIALLVSWIVAVVFTPYIGYKLLDPKALIAKAQKHGDDIYDTPFYRRFRGLLTWCLRNRWQVIAATVLMFVLAMAAFSLFVQQEFFPPSSRTELLVDVWLPQGASIKGTTREVQRIEQLIRDDPAVEHFSSYIGNGAPRFILTLHQELSVDNFGQIVVVTKNLQAREEFKRHMEARFAAPDFADIRVRVTRLENGPRSDIRCSSA